MSHPIDIIGDIHGEKPALFELGRQLGYDIERGWVHPDGRLPVFLGDLIDRGGHSLEVAELVRHLVATGRGACILGNHEYNLVAWHLKIPGYEQGKTSNEATRRDFEKHRERWTAVVNFFRALPMAYELPQLRIIHAAWHLASIRVVEETLKPRTARAAALTATAGWLAAHVALDSPFDEKGLKPQLPGKPRNEADPPHEILIKGHEVECEEFRDVDGVPRTSRRVTWWNEEQQSVGTGRLQVVGHYWNLPPVVEGQFFPPHSSGHPKLREWQKQNAGKVRGPGRMSLPENLTVACIDFNGLTQADGKRACVGALRWPEREVVWATSHSTRPG